MCYWTHQTGHSLAVAYKGGEVLAVEGRQVVLKLLVQEDFTALPYDLPWGGLHAVLAVVDSDAGSGRDFDVPDVLHADPGP